MTQKNSLMEWLEQTKRLTKNLDMDAIRLIDQILDDQYLVHPDLIRKYKRFFDKYCRQYHKPSPTEYLLSGKLQEEFKRGHNGEDIGGYLIRIMKVPTRWRRENYWNCPVFQFIRVKITCHVKYQIEDILKREEALRWQWFEIIDFMFERPELINASLLDEYTEQTITSVCEKHKKNNPLKDGVRQRFGKFWKDKNGHWHKERRRRL